MKEVRFRDPDRRNPERFALKALFDKPGKDDLIEVHLEWEDGSWGTKVPIVVIRRGE